MGGAVLSTLTPILFLKFYFRRAVIKRAVYFRRAVTERTVLFQEGAGGCKEDRVYRVQGTRLGCL